MAYLKDFDRTSTAASETRWYDDYLLGDVGSVKRKAGWLAIAALTALSFGALLLPHAPHPRLAILTPIVYFVAVLSDLVTAIILLADWRTSPVRRSIFVLALAFVSGALVLLAAMLFLPLLPSGLAVIEAAPQAGEWLFIFWHAAVAIGALAYVPLRADDRALSPRFAFIAVAGAVGLVATAGIVAFVFSGRLPALATGTSLTSLVSTGTGPCVAALLAVASLMAFRIREPTAIDRAYALSIVLLLIEFTFLLIDAQRYSFSYYWGRILVLLGAALVLVSAEKTLIASRSRLVQIEWAFDRVRGESARRAGRVRAVWQIASYADKSDVADFGAILEIAAAALRPGKPFVGLLCHLDGGTLFIDATSSSGFESSALAASSALHPGASFPAERTMANLLRGESRARAWDDFVTVATSSTVAEELGFRSFIGSPVATDQGSYFVTFTSPDATKDEPYEEDDLAYIEVVASFFSNRFKQQHHHQRFQFHSEHDTLTGLVNRMRFRTDARDAIRAGEPFAIALLNLDGFRHVNERHGHETGDELLVEVAGALSSVAGSDTVARMSADEFGIILYDTGSLDELATRLERYADTLRRRFHAVGSTGTNGLTVGASIGAARYPEDGESPQDLMRRADVALEVAKTHGGTTQVFDRAMESIAEEARKRVSELAEAIASDQLFLAYQPTFDLATRAVVGAEALVRWDHPVRGRLPPLEFIELAERNGLIGPLSRWVCHRVARDLLSVRDLPPGFRVYFNVSAQLLDDVPFISSVRELLKSNPRLADHLGIEVTETAAMQNVERSIDTLEIFRRWGLSVAIDDFGTGYSSLSYLKKLTVDIIKIDRSFVMGLPDDERDCAITEMLLSMTARFEYATLAEGIETEGQLSWLLEHGCRFGQGYLIARPQGFDCLLERLGLVARSLTV
jgi:diguanylate cyclase (GGDEF)-like protein